MSKRSIQLLVAAVALAFLAGFAVWRRLPAAPEPEQSLDAFARCLSQKGAVMYGAYWCPHCQNQKSMFGDAFRFVNYVECTEKPHVCTDAGIQGFPTWIFPGGMKLVGVQSLESLAEVSGCTLGAGR